MESLFEYARESFFLLVGPEPLFLVYEFEDYVTSILQFIW
jgi:hypothetical protein